VDLHFLMPALGYPQFAQVCFCTWRDRWPGASVSIPATATISSSMSIPQRLHRTCVLLCRFPKLPVPLAVRKLSVS